jgi:phosphoadenosine phosphosulfate reductase
MNKELVEFLIKKSARLEPAQLLSVLLEQFGDKVALASSFGAEDQVLTDMLCKISNSCHIFTLDTERLHQETYDAMEATREKYGVTINVLFPDRQSVEAMVNEQGPNLFYKSIENRKRCCGVRKLEPLTRHLATLDAWIVGLRKEQSVTRGDLERIAWDSANGLIKINPLLDWTTNQVWDYIKSNDVPYNKLHDQGFPSIGCAPCTRAVKEGEDIRAGRWWWEKPEHKECGLHWDKR